MTGVGRFASLTIDAVDADRVARFWAELLGTRIGSVWDDGRFVFLEGGDELPVVCVQWVPEPKGGKNRGMPKEASSTWPWSRTTRSRARAGG